MLLLCSTIEGLSKIGNIMAKIIIDVKDIGEDPEGKHLVGFDVTGVKAHNDPKWVLGVAEVLKEAVNVLLENTMGVNKKAWKKKEK